MSSVSIKSKALLITPSFFGYEQDIARAIRECGYATTFLDERPSNGALARAIMRVRKDLVARQIDSYYRSALQDLSAVHFDLVVVIKAEVVPRWFLEQLRERSPAARFVFYTYDTLANAGNCQDVLSCFDQCFSFDRSDVASHPKFSYLPLFYTPEFHSTPASQGLSRRPYDLSFVGTLHSGRYRFAKKLAEVSGRAFEFYYVQAAWYFAFTKYVSRENSNVPWKAVSFTSMQRDDIAEVFRESHAVLDIPRFGQSGLTMRTFEVLASGSVLVTTNESVREEPFFDPSRVVIAPSDFDARDLSGLWRSVRSLETPVGPPAGFEEYSLASWATRIVGLR